MYIYNICVYVYVYGYLLFLYYFVSMSGYLVKYKRLYINTTILMYMCIHAYTGYDISKALCNLDEDSRNNSRSKKPVRPPPPPHPQTSFNLGDLSTSPPSSSTLAVTTGVVESADAYSSSSSGSESSGGSSGIVLPQGHMASLGARFMIAQVRVGLS